MNVQFSIWVFTRRDFVIYFLCTCKTRCGRRSARTQHDDMQSYNLFSHFFTTWLNWRICFAIFMRCVMFGASVRWWALYGPAPLQKCLFYSSNTVSKLAPGKKVHPSPVVLFWSSIFIRIFLSRCKASSQIGWKKYDVWVTRRVV